MTTMTPDTRTDEDLMRRYVAGDRRAFDALYRRLAPKVNALLLRLTHNRECAEELTQVTFLKVHRARETYIPDAKVSTWVNAIARNVFLDAYRRDKARRAELLTNDGTLPEPPPVREDVTAYDALPDEVRARINDTIAALPASQREALVMLKGEGLTLREASRRTGATVGAVKVRAHRAYTALRTAVSASAP